MTIQRVGPTPEVVKTHTQNLGNVLVTIDDLEALLELLKPHIVKIRQWIISPTTPLGAIEFDGGYFTEPEELRKLSDEEARSLRINIPTVQIILSPTRAVAIGDEKITDEVYRLWARQRPASITRIRRVQQRDFGIGFTALLLLLIPSALALFSAVRNLTNTSAFWPGAAALGFSVAAVVWYVRATKPRRRIDKVSFALIVPSTLDEYRRSQSADNYPRKQWFVAIWAIVASLLGAAVGAAVTIYIAVYGKG